MNENEEIPVPESIEEFVPSCVVCKGPVPAKRKGTMTHTCGPVCHAKYKKWKDFKRKTLKCPTCSRPATVDERKDFIAWRKSRGERFEGRGNPARKEMALRKALGEAIKAMNELLSGDDSPHYRDLTARFQNLVDGKAAVSSTLAASGQPPEEKD